MAFLIAQGDEKARMEQVRLLKNLLGERIMLVAGCPALLAMPGADEYMEFASILMERPVEIEYRAGKHPAEPPPPC